MNKEELEEERKDIKGKVDWYIFVWSMGIILAVFGWMFAQFIQIQTVHIAQAVKDTEIRVQLSQIQTDILWIREKLSKNQ